MGDYEEIQVLPTGVYRVTYKQLTPSQIKALRTRTQKKLKELKRKQGAHLLRVNEIEDEAETVSRFLEETQNPEVDGYIQRYEEQKAQAEEKAETFLREFVGEEEYEKFKKNRFLDFTDRNDQYWRVYSDGTAMRWENGSLRRVCVIRQKALPLPDHIVSVIQTIREQPERLVNLRR